MGPSRETKGSDKIANVGYREILEEVTIFLGKT